MLRRWLVRVIGVVSFSIHSPGGADMSHCVIGVMESIGLDTVNDPVNHDIERKIPSCLLAALTLHISSFCNSGCCSVWKKEASSSVSLLSFENLSVRSQYNKSVETKAGHVFETDTPNTIDGLVPRPHHRRCLPCFKHDPLFFCCCCCFSILLVVYCSFLMMTT